MWKHNRNNDRLKTTAEEAIKYIQETAQKGENKGYFVTYVGREDLLRHLDEKTLDELGQTETDALLNSVASDMQKLYESDSYDDALYEELEVRKLL